MFIVLVRTFKVTKSYRLSVYTVIIQENGKVKQLIKAKQELIIEQGLMIYGIFQPFLLNCAATIIVKEFDSMNWN